MFKIHWSLRSFKIQNATSSSDCTSSLDPHQCNDTVLSDNAVVSRIIAILPAAQNPSSQNHAASTEALPSYSRGRWRSHRRKIGVYLYVGQVVLQAHSDNYVLPLKISGANPLLVFEFQLWLWAGSHRVRSAANCSRISNGPMRHLWWKGSCPTLGQSGFQPHTERCSDGECPRRLSTHNVIDSAIKKTSIFGIALGLVCTH